MCPKLRESIPCRRFDAWGLLQADAGRRMSVGEEVQMTRVAIVAMALLAGSVSVDVASAQDAGAEFPKPAELVPAVDFWTRVYTEIGTDEGFIHDTENLAVVYESVEVASSSRQRRRIVQNRTEHYREILSELGRGKRSGLSTEEARVLALWPDGVSNAELRAAAGRLRFQLGQANRFRAGLVRSGRWRAYIDKVLDDRGLPRELAVLPHVESSFDPTAYSHAGAAGMWQFTRSTGRRYMRIDHIVDERRDPFLSTHAAARLLEDNYSVIRTWPLALTAYNHGLGGMRRAVRQVGTRDIDAIVREYNGRSFGFASRNFYTAFLAALEVDTNSERYFGPLELDPPADFVLASMPDYVDAAELSRALNMSLADLRRFNPALADTVWAGDKYVPRGFELRLPRTPDTEPRTLLANLPAEARFAAQRPDEYHRVSSGETLSGIAAQYRVSLAALVRMNGLSNRNFIRVGQVLTLPTTGAGAPTPALAARAAEGGDSVAAAVAVSGEYVVRRGDSIDRIARTLGVDQAALLRLNGVSNRNLIYPGQVLRIPARGSAIESPATAVLAAREPAPVPEQVEADAVAVVAVAEVAPAAVDLPAGFDAADFVGPPVIVALNDEPDPDDGSDSNALDSVQATLAADPSDYSVADDGTIEVQSLETLGHYADWLGIRTQRLRDLNGMSFGQAVVLGQRIRLDFSAVDPGAFEQRRIAWQQSLQEAFFAAYRIANVEDHVVRSGESLWLLAQNRYRVPVWLLRQYNPDLELDLVVPGTVVKFPRLEPIAG